MVRTLVLTVDRDNDLGVKAGIRGPVVGRKAALSAALRLGIADPEESDTNAILGALHHHDQLVEGAQGNDEVEIALLTGDVRVGPRSDRAIAMQLDEVIQEFQPDSAVLVTDGADDEASLPIITSRVRVDHVEKVIVRQSKGIESTYYYIAKAIDDPRWRARLLVPVAVFLMIFGLGLILPNGAALIGAMPLVVGIWLLAKGLGWERQFDRLMIDMRESATGGIWSSLLWGLSIVSVLLSVLTAYQVFSSSTSEIADYVADLGSDFDVDAGSGCLHLYQSSFGSHIGRDGWIGFQSRLSKRQRYLVHTCVHYSSVLPTENRSDVRNRRRRDIRRGAFLGCLIRPRMSIPSCMQGM